MVYLPDCEILETTTRRSVQQSFKQIAHQQLLLAQSIDQYTVLALPKHDFSEIIPHFAIDCEV